MLVRRFAEKDAKEVSDLIIKTIRISNTKDYPVEMMEKLTRRKQPEDVLKRASWTHFYVVEENSAIVGAALSGRIGIRQMRAACLQSLSFPNIKDAG